MEILQVEFHPATELMARLRQVPLQERPEVKIYANALISLEFIHTNYLWPPQNYIWLAELRKVQNLRWSLQEHGFDMFRLNGFVTYTVRQADGELRTYDLYPPIIEESFEADGTVALLINDGMHRVYLARQAWIVPQVVYIRPEGWQHLDLLPDNPETNRYLKKCHRLRHNKVLFRNFQAVFRNVGGSRSVLHQTR